MKMRLFSTLVSILVLSTTLLVPDGRAVLITIPSGYSLIANPLDAVGGNTLDKVLPDTSGVEIGDTILKFDCATQEFKVVAIYDGSDTWVNSIYDPLDPTTVTLAPGEGFFYSNANGSRSLTFNGTALPSGASSFPCGCGKTNSVSSKDGNPAHYPTTYDNIVGSPPVNGSVLIQFVNQTASYAFYTFTNCAWSPSVPSVAMGQGVLIKVPCSSIPCDTNPCTAVTITCPANITYNICGTNVAVNYSSPTVTNGALMSSVPVSGSGFGLGTNVVTCTATNACSTNTCTFNVTVTQTAAVGITCPANITTNTCGTNVVVNYPTPTVTGGALRSSLPLNGSSFGLGTTVVTCTATNACSTNACTFNVTVQSLQPDFQNGDFAFAVPLNGTGGGWTSSGINSQGGWNTTFGNPGGGFLLNDIGSIGQNPTIQQTICCLQTGLCYTIHWQTKVQFYGGNPTNLPSFGVLLDGHLIDSLNVGPNDFVWHQFSTTFTATNSCQTIGFAAEADPTDVSYYLDNVWLEPCGCFQFNCLSNLVAYTCSSNAIVNFTVSATNLCNTNLISVTSTPASGSTFPLGTTTVTNTAQDSAGHLTLCSFTVTVLPYPSSLVCTCASSKTVPCGTNWDFDAPTNIIDYCCTNYSVTFTTVTNSYFCPLVFTRTWLISDTCGNSNICSQTVTVINTTLPVFTNCPASMDLGCNPTNIPDRDPNVRAINGCGSATLPTYLLVSSLNSNQVVRYNGSTGAFVDIYAFGGGLNGPEGLTFGSDGNLYISSFFSNEVKRHNETTISTFVSAGGSGGLNGPGGLVFGRDGNLYVSSYYTSEVKRYNGTSGAPGTFVSAGSGGLNHPVGLVFGPDGNLYVSSGNTASVLRYDWATGLPIGSGIFVSAGSGGLSQPYGLAFGPDGNLYVSSLGTGQVKRYAGPMSINPAPGTFIDNFVLGGLSLPYGLVFGPDGNLYVSAEGTSEVNRYNGTSGILMGTFVSAGSGGLSASTFLTFTPSFPVITSTKVDSTNGCSRTRTITYTAVDPCGNSNTCTQLITWTVDTTPPIITGSHSAVTLGCNPVSLPTDTVLKAQVTATDNCGIASTNVTHVDGGTLCASNRTFTITVTDACGNAAVTNVVYTWTIDHSLPVITIAPTLLNLNCNPAAASLPTDAYVTTLVRATDNCSLASTNVTHVDGGTACASNRTFTITVRDACSNSASTNLVYTWKVDHTLPSITCLTNKIIVRLNTNCQLVIPPVGVKASDNCTPTSQLVFKQSPTNGTIVLVKQMNVTVTVYDACGNSNSCTALVIGQDQLGPVVSGPTTLAVTNCLMPSVTTLVTASDNCCPQKSLTKTQSPAPNTPLGPGVYSVTVTVTDCNGNSTPWKIQLTVSPTASFLTNLFNTGVNASRALQPIGAVDPHYTLGPVAAGTVTGAGNYNAPNAIVASNFWTLPPTYPSGKSAWIAPSTNKNGYPKGYYVYTNQFTLPVTADAASASISGRWAADNGAQMYFNGSATPITAITAPNGYTKWSPFTISGGFLPNLNTILFVVSNSPSGLFGSGTSITGLRVEYTNAVANCYTCAPPAIINISTEQTVPQHGAVTFYVAASGTPPLSYQWFYNGVALQNTSLYSGVNSDTLFIKPVDYPLGGIYTVVISNPCGSATAKTKLSVSRGLGWASGMWNVAQPDNPLAATTGPDLNLVSTSDYGMNYTITAGTTEDFELPAPAGHVVNVMHIAPLPVDTSIQIPLIAPPGSNSVNSYSVIMDLYQPASSAGTPSTLFQSVWCCIGSSGQDGVALTLDAQNNLHIAGSAAGVPFDVASAVPLPIEAWSRVALVIDDPQDGIGINLFLYLNGQMVASLNLLTPAGLPINWNNDAPTLFSRQTNDVSLNGDFYVSSIQFHAIALAPQDIAGMGSPDAGPVPLNEPVVGAQPVLAAAVVNGTISFSWTGDLFVLQETADLTGGDWADSMLPFTESVVNGDIQTTAVADPSIEGPSKFYRLIFRP